MVDDRLCIEEPSRFFVRGERTGHFGGVEGAEARRRDVVDREKERQAIRGDLPSVAAFHPLRVRLVGGLSSVRQLQLEDDGRVADALAGARRAVATVESPGREL